MAGDVKNVAAVAPVLWSSSCALWRGRSSMGRTPHCATEPSVFLWGTVWGAGTARDFT